MLYADSLLVSPSLHSLHFVQLLDLLLELRVSYCSGQYTNKSPGLIPIMFCIVQLIRSPLVLPAMVCQLLQ